MKHQWRQTVVKFVKMAASTRQQLKPESMGASVACMRSFYWLSLFKLTEGEENPKGKGKERFSAWHYEKKKVKITKMRKREESDKEVSVPYKLHEELQEIYILIKKRTKDNEMLFSNSQNPQITGKKIRSCLKS